MRRNSSSDGDSRILAASEKTRILSELANIRDEIESGIRFVEKFGDIVPELETHQDLAGIRLENIPAQVAAPLKEFWKIKQDHNVLPLRNEIRKIWKERDLTVKRLGVLRIAQHQYHQLWASDTDPSWAFPNADRASRLRFPTPFQQILEYLIRPNVHTSICTNPRCSAPYFFSSRLGQKFCSDACALPAQREFKRRWWAEHGRKWRANRKKKRLRGKRR